MKAFYYGRRKEMITGTLYKFIPDDDLNCSLLLIV